MIIIRKVINFKAVMEGAGARKKIKDERFSVESDAQVGSWEEALS